MIVRKGNLLLLKKIDQLEEVADRLHHEKWDLYAIKVESTALRDECISRSDSLARSNYKSRTQNTNNINEVQNQIQHERIPRDVLDKIEGIDSADAAKALGTLTALGIKKKTYKQKAYGPEAETGPKLRRLAYKIIRWKYDDQKSQKEIKTRREMELLQSTTSAETSDEILAGMKEQKDITLFLEDAVGKLRARHAILLKRRERLEAQQDFLVARFSKGIDEYDDEGKQK